MAQLKVSLALDYGVHMLIDEADLEKILSIIKNARYYESIGYGSDRKLIHTDKVPTLELIHPGQVAQDTLEMLVQNIPIRPTNTDTDAPF